MSVIYTKRGKLSAYGIRCGYIERKELADKRVTLFNEHGYIYLVNITNLPALDGYVKGFDRLADARKFFNSFK